MRRLLPFEKGQGFFVTSVLFAVFTFRTTLFVAPALLERFDGGDYKGVLMALFKIALFAIPTLLFIKRALREVAKPVEPF